MLQRVVVDRALHSATATSCQHANHSLGNVISISWLPISSSSLLSAGAGSPSCRQPLNRCNPSARAVAVSFADKRWINAAPSQFRHHLYGLRRYRQGVAVKEDSAGYKYLWTDISSRWADHFMQVHEKCPNHGQTMTRINYAMTQLCSFGYKLHGEIKCHQSVF